MYVCIYIYIYVSVYIYIYVYITCYIYIYIYTYRFVTCCMPSASCVYPKRPTHIRGFNCWFERGSGPQGTRAKGHFCEEWVEERTEEEGGWDFFEDGGDSSKMGGVLRSSGSEERRTPPSSTFSSRAYPTPSGEHEPGRIKPGRIKRAALSLQHRNHYIYFFFAGRNIPAHSNYRYIFLGPVFQESIVNNLHRFAIGEQLYAIYI